MRAVFKSMLIATAFVGGIALSAPALAQSAEDLRGSGAACEQPDGYMRALAPDAQQAVNQINAQRRQFYEMRAAEEGVDAAAVAAVFAMEIRNQPNYRGC